VRFHTSLSILFARMRLPPRHIAALEFEVWVGLPQPMRLEAPYRVWAGGTWRARGARAYNGGLRAEPPTGSRGRAPGLVEGQGGEEPVKLKVCERGRQKKMTNLPPFSPLFPGRARNGLKL